MRYTQVYLLFFDKPKIKLLNLRTSSILRYKREKNNSSRKNKLLVFVVLDVIDVTSKLLWDIKGLTFPIEILRLTTVLAITAAGLPWEMLWQRCQVGAGPGGQLAR